MSQLHHLTATVYDKKGRVLSIGHNSYTKTHPRQAKLAGMVGQSGRNFMHAEIAALVRVKHGVPYKIKITRFNNAGESKLAKPCEICALAIKLAGIKFIEYSV